MTRTITIIIIGLTFLSCSRIIKDQEKLLKPGHSPTDSVAVAYTLKIDSLYNYYFNSEMIDSSEVSTKIKKAKKIETDLKITLDIHKSIIIKDIVTIMDICKDLDVEIILKTK